MFLSQRVFPLTRPSTFRRDLDQLFKQFHGGLGDLWPLDESAVPALNIWDDGENIRAEAEVPGFKLDQLDVSVLGKQLTIKGRREFEAEEGATFHRRERSNGEFSRSLTLPVEVDAEKVTATLKDGVLTIVLPKSQAALVRRIEVKSV